MITNVDFADRVAEASESVAGVESATVGESNDQVAQVTVVLDAAAETPESFAAVEALRDTVHEIDGADALVGGLDAQSLDVNRAQVADQDLVIPLILGLVFLVLVLLLRALVAPILLLLTVVVFLREPRSELALFQSVFGFPAIDTNVILFSFLFLVALGLQHLPHTGQGRGGGHGT